MIKKFFGAIVRFIDKKIILPITRLFVSASNLFSTNGRTLEKFLSKKTGLIIVSLCIALIFYGLTINKSNSLVETSAEVLYNQPISATYNEEAYVIDGLPKTVDITLIGRKSDVYLAKQLPTNDITVDLSGLKPGVHKVNLKYKKALSSVEYKLDPSVATIVIYEKVSEEKEVNYEVINKDKINSKLNVQETTLSTEKVYVKGNEATLKEVASVKALIDLNELPKVENDNWESLIGTRILKNVKLVAYNSDGKKVKAEIVPSKITATIKISSEQKEIPIKIIPKNYDKILFGKAIKEMTPDITKVTIYGDQSRIDKITYLPVYLDVDGLKSDKKFSITLNKPNGVRAISSNTVNVDVKLDDETAKEFDNIYLEYENLNPNLSVQAINQESTKVTVSVKGVESVLNSLDPASIKAYVDLKDLDVGEHNIDVKVTGSDLRGKYESKTVKVTLRIMEKKQ